MCVWQRPGKFQIIVLLWRNLLKSIKFPLSKKKVFVVFWILTAIQFISDGEKKQSKNTLLVNQPQKFLREVRRASGHLRILDCMHVPFLFKWLGNHAWKHPLSKNSVKIQIRHLLEAPVNPFVRTSSSFDNSRPATQVSAAGIYVFKINFFPFYRKLIQMFFMENFKQTNKDHY